MSNTFTAEQRLDVARQRLAADQAALAQMTERLSILSAAASLRSTTTGGHSEAESAEAAGLEERIAATMSSVEVQHIAVRVAEADVAAGADEHAAELSDARADIAAGLGRRAELMADDALRAKAIKLARAGVADAQAELDEFARAVEQPANAEAAAILRAQAAGEPVLARKVDPQDVRRRKFDLTEALAEAQAALTEIEAQRPDGETVATCDNRIRDDVRHALIAIGKAAVKRATHHRRAALRQEILARAIGQVVKGALDIPIYKFEQVSGGATFGMTGPGGRIGVNDARGVIDRFAHALAGDAFAELDLDAAFADGTIWLNPPDRG
jgi:chromosome segregation ATPase